MTMAANILNVIGEDRTICLENSILIGHARSGGKKVV